jgi:hypothetical protein
MESSRTHTRDSSLNGLNPAKSSDDEYSFFHLKLGESSVTLVCVLELSYEHVGRPAWLQQHLGILLSKECTEFTCRVILLTCVQILLTSVARMFRGWN